MRHCLKTAATKTGAAGFGKPALFLALLGLYGCGLQPACRPGEQATRLESLYFGRHAPDGEVRQEQWDAFLAQTVTPNFPQGLTSWQAYGQWRAADGTAIRENTWVLQLALAEADGQDGRVAEIIQRYRADFKQEAVLRIRQSACASF